MAEHFEDRVLVPITLQLRIRQSELLGGIWPLQS